MSTTNVDLDEFQTDAPGPGSYNIGSALGGRKSAISGRPRERNRSDAPGPGQYALGSTLKRGSSSLKGRQSSFGSTTETPGPGAYTIETRKHTAGSSLSSRPRERRTDNMPGPGMYDSEKHGAIGSQGRTTSLKARSFMPNARSDAPGPGAYAPENTVKPGPKYTMSHRTRTMFRRSDEPGPGQYDTTSRPQTGGVSISGRTKVKRTVLAHLAKFED